jgi:sulfite exporter TauE/SafE
MFSSFLIGLLGGLGATAHCLGMCGGFPLHLSRASQRVPAFVRQCLYVAGKAFTYAFLGTLFGAIGSQLVASGWLPSAQKYLAWGAGAALVLFGLGMIGVKLPALASWFQAYEWGFVQSVYRQFFIQPGGWSSFLLGAATGFLPCPITLAMLALAAASHSPFRGFLLLVGLGLGTAPGLMAVGLGGNLIDARWKRIGLRPAGLIVIAIGLITLLRTQDFMHRHCHNPSAQAEACCAHSTAAESAPTVPPVTPSHHGQP